MLNNGQQIGRYRILSAIGAGGMGEVFLADDSALNRKVALKVLSETFATDGERLRRFEQEAKAASALNHPNILTIYEFGAAGGLHFLASEFVAGETLRERLKRSGFTLQEKLDITIQIASALQAAHEAGIIHRDIKPENIMIRSDGYVKVLDFGLAKLVETTPIDETAETKMQVQTQAGIVMGTVAYMSPEQARGRQALDARTDIFSLGVVLYEMLTRRQPFTGETINHTIVAILEKDPPPLAEFIGDYPAEIERIIKKALARNKEERYKTAKDLSADLKALQKRLEFEAELERASAPTINLEARTEYIETITREKTAPTQTTSQTNSIAVLPFANMSTDLENEYFCDGLAEELLNALSKIENLKVAARTSAFSFKGKNATVSEIGRALSVNTVLEGSVRRSGNRIRITVQLVNAADGYHLWSERYDREMKSIFDVQDEIALAVVDALKVKFLGEEKALVLKRYTESTEAYELYLKGRYHYNKFTVEGWKKAIEYFEEAIRQEPEYAPAFAGIALCRLSFWFYGVVPPHEIVPLWREATNRALELDKDLGKAHLSLANIHFFYEWDWEAAEREYKRALELNPNSADAHWWYGEFLGSRERFDEAIKMGRRAVELDPLSLLAMLNNGWIYLFADRLDDALAQARKMIEIEPNFHGAYWQMGAVYLSKGMYPEAVEAYEKSVALGGNQMERSGLSAACSALGRPDQAREILHQLLEMRKHQNVSAFDIARAYSGLGEDDLAFEWMDKACAERNGEIVFLRREAKAGTGSIWGTSFRADPRFQDILRRVGLPSDESKPNKTTDETSEAKTEILSAPAIDTGEVPAAAATATRKNVEQTIPEKTTRNWLLIALLSLFILTAAGFFAYRNLAPANNKQIESIAVLPFENASGNAELDYLSDGVSESLIDRLSGLTQLKVIARSSSFRFRNPNPNFKEIADALDVQTIVTGRVVQRGDSYNIRVELVDARENKQLWGENFTRRASDAQALQTDISREIVENLRLKLSGTQTQQLAKQAMNPQAYELVLKGIYYRNKGGPENQKKAIECFQQAIVIDPNYALAYAGLADAYRFLGGDPKETLPKREAAIRRALELDENLAEAHFDMGQYHRDLWNWPEAEREYRRAMQLNPNYANAHSGLSGLLSLLGRHDEAVAEDKRATELDPVGVIVNTVAGRTLHYARRYDEAIEQLKKTIELEPGNTNAHVRLADVYVTKGMYREAVAEYQLTIKLGGAGNDVQGRLGAAYAKMGEREQALAILKRLQTGDGYISPVQLAILQAALGEPEQAFASLEKAYAVRFPSLQFLKVEPVYDSLRSDPRFADLMRRVGLPQ